MRRLSRHYIWAIVAVVGACILVLAVGAWLWHRGSKYKRLAAANDNIAAAYPSRTATMLGRMRVGLPFGHLGFQQSSPGDPLFNLSGAHTYVHTHGPYSNHESAELSSLGGYGSSRGYGNEDYGERSRTPYELPRPPLLRLLNPDPESSSESLAISPVVPEGASVTAGSDIPALRQSLDIGVK